MGSAPSATSIASSPTTVSAGATGGGPHPCRLGRYLRGQLYLILIMSVASYIVLRIFDVPYALPIAIGTGILEIVPFVGPIIAGTLASLVALSTHGVGPMIGVVIAYFILRQIEDQIVVPQVIGRVVHLDPVVTIFVVLAGRTAGGDPWRTAGRAARRRRARHHRRSIPAQTRRRRPSALTTLAVAGTGLPNDPERAQPQAGCDRKAIRRPRLAVRIPRRN